MFSAIQSTSRESKMKKKIVEGYPFPYLDVLMTFSFRFGFKRNKNPIKLLLIDY